MVSFLIFPTHSLFIELNSFRYLDNKEKIRSIVTVSNKLCL